jgi:hypothetical protein
VERGDVPVTNRLLAAGVRRDALDGEIDLDEALRIAVWVRHRWPPGWPSPARGSAPP